MTTENTPGSGDTGGASGAPAAAPAAGGTQPNPTPAPSAPNNNASGSAGGTEPSQSGGSATPADGYKIPDAYKDRPWAAKITSEQDLWKQLDNAQQVIGKKAISPVPDFEKATPEQVEEYYKQTRPADVSAYKFSEETSPEAQKAISDAFFKHGVSAHQANAVIKEYQAMEAEAVKDLYSEDGMKAEMSKKFGEGWEGTVGNVKNIFNILYKGDEAKQQMIDKLPNPMLAVVMQVASDLIRGYGINEKNIPGNDTPGGGGAAGGDLDKQAADLRNQIAALARRPHTEEEKQNLVDQLHAINQKIVSRTTK